MEGTKPSMELEAGSATGWTEAKGEPVVESWSTAIDPVRAVAIQCAWNKEPMIGVVPSLIEGDGPAVLSIQVRSQTPRAIGFTFPEIGLLAAQAANPAPTTPKGNPISEAVQEEGASTPSVDVGPPRSRWTRIRPPGDLVKLEDRLYYLLQPPLETLVSSARLTFPFEPFPYQMEGIGFLFSRGAAILADEMGLGKTMQAITTIRMLVMAGEVGKVLLVCPKPLVTNWVREFRLWAPEIPLAVIEGDAAKRNWIWQQATTPVKIANYELMMRDWEAMQESGVQFDLMVLDEAQRIKNRNSSTSSIIRSVPRQRSWALTGTPIENSSDDLVSIFEFLSPGFLHDGMSLREMGEATGDFILRRTKDKVLTEMPPKMYRDAMLELTGDQWASYKSAEEEGVIQLSDMGDALTIQHVFELVLRLKQICNFDPLTSSSAKLERLEADLEEVAASGQKAIVFSQWVDTLDKISDRLQRFQPLHYHGRVPSNKRDGVIERFRSDPKCHVILMSYGAGAVGLNLQFCRYVFLFDRWWNPAVEDQAINRAHRLGAAGTVTITRMTSVQTIEQRIHHVLEEKRSLAETLFAEGNGPANLGMTSEEIFGLFRLKRPARAA